MGYGLIGVYKKAHKFITCGIIDLSKKKDHYLKLQGIFQRCLILIDQYNPDELAIEAPFYGKNVQSMLKLGRAQGVTMAAALQRNIPVIEYAPKRIKQAITGSGSASKEQVSAMVLSILNVEKKPKYLDATDALSVALCHLYTKDSFGSEKGYKDWGTFIDKNKDKII